MLKVISISFCSVQKLVRASSGVPVRGSQMQVRGNAEEPVMYILCHGTSWVVLVFVQETSNLCFYVQYHYCVLLQEAQRCQANHGTFELFCVG